MKILMVLETHFPPDKRVENEIESLIGAGHDITLLCRARERDAAEEKIGRLQVCRLRMGSLVYKSSVGALSFPLYFSFWRRNLRSILRRSRFDFVHLHDLPLAAVVYGLRKEFGFRMVLDLHENWPALLGVSRHTKSLTGRILSRDSSWRSYEKRYVQLADEVIVVVDEFRTRLMELTGRDKGIHVVMNTLNLKELEGMALSTSGSSGSGRLKILYTGGLTYHRGLQYVLEALGKNPSLPEMVELHIAGSGSYLDELKKVSSRHNLESCVRFYGHVTQSEVFRLQAEADITIIPHIRSEQTDAGMPHKMFQYMYFNKPIISSDCRPAARIIEETGSGVIYIYDDTAALSEMIGRFAGDRGLLEKYRSGREHVIEKYNWETDGAVLTSIYQTYE